MFTNLSIFVWHLPSRITIILNMLIPIGVNDVMSGNGIRSKPFSDLSGMNLQKCIFRRKVYKRDVIMQIRRHINCVVPALSGQGGNDFFD